MSELLNQIDEHTLETFRKVCSGEVPDETAEMYLRVKKLADHCDAGRAPAWILALIADLSMSGEPEPVRIPEPPGEVPAEWAHAVEGDPVELTDGEDVLEGTFKGIDREKGRLLVKIGRGIRKVEARNVKLLETVNG